MKLILIDNIKKTASTFFFNHNTLEIEEIEIFLIESGEGVIHELIELDLIRAVLKIEKGVIDYDWEFYKNLLHVITNWHKKKGRIGDCINSQEEKNGTA